MKFANINRQFYAMAAVDDTTAEITMYGDIYERRPIDFWSGEPIEGSFILQDEFLEDLESVINAGVKNLRIRMNSCGGDAGVALTIHNRLRELAASGVALTCVVDGVAMSGGSVIMCACDTVEAYPTSLIMIHKAWSFLFGGYNADELRALAKTRDAWDQALCEVYTKKTGLSETVVKHMMSETTYMTGREAHEKGFTDTLLEDEVEHVAASADRQDIFAFGRKIHLPIGIAPDCIPQVKEISTASAEDIDSKPADNGNNETGGNIQMARNLEELRTENPELAAQVEQDVRAALSAENADAINTATNAERTRISEIDEIASLYSDEMVREAKYGNPCTAQELTYRAAQKAAKTGTTFMANVEADNAASNANNVGTVPAEEDKPKAMTKEDKKAAGEAMSKRINENK